MNASDRYVRRILVGLAVVALLGLASFVATVQNGRAASNASKADVERTTMLTQRVAELQELAARVSSTRSDASEARQLTICLRLAQLLQEQGLPVRGPCPANPDAPVPTPIPSPS